MSGWTDKCVERMRALYGSTGQSCGQIAKTLNAEFGTAHTRNSVIGKLHRLGVVGQVRRPASAPVARGRPRGPAAPKTYHAPVTSRPVREPPWYKRPAPDMGHGTGQGIRFFDRKPCQCAWPIGPYSEPGHMNMAVCGDPVPPEGRSYCAKHHAMSVGQTQPSGGSTELARSLRRYAA